MTPGYTNLTVAAFLQQASSEDPDVTAGFLSHMLHVAAEWAATSDTVKSGDSGFKNFLARNMHLFL